MNWLPNDKQIYVYSFRTQELLKKKKTTYFICCDSLQLFDGAQNAPSLASVFSYGYSTKLSQT